MMSTTKLVTGKYRRPEGRVRPHFDRLESRLALSTMGTDLSSVSTVPGIQGTLLVGSNSPLAIADPAPDSVVDKSPSAFAITFNDPIDPLSIGNNDFTLVHVAADGSTAPLTPSEASLNEAADPTAPSGTRIILSLSRPLTNGKYLLLLSAGNLLQAKDGSFLSVSRTDLEVLAFSVATPGHGLSQAIDLGTPTADVAAKSDTLDLSDMPGDFKLYKLAVPAGHFWRLGLAVTTPSARNPLLPVLSLFDAQGHLITTSSQGRPDSPDDPFLFAGVEPGTYYVGISGSGDIPGQVGGYDPALGVLGAAGLAQPGGTFQIDFVADPADVPTQILGLMVDRADPDSTVPTGLTVQFSGSIRLGDLLLKGQDALAAVDASGKSWALKATRYDESRAQLSVVFDRALPPGVYSLVAPAGGLVDLAGEVPVSSGRPAGDFGSFTISNGATAAGDLGAILPGAGKDGVSTAVDVNPGASVVEHFTVIEAGLYTISGVNGPTSLSFALRTADGSVVAVTSSHDGSGAVEGVLRPGSYSLTLTNPRAAVVGGSIGVVERQSLRDSLLVGGVAQGPALNLRLIAPTLSSGVGPQGSPGPSNGIAQGEPSPAAPARESGAASAVGSGTISLFLTGPVGRPSPTGGQISVVGPSGPSGSVALASSARGLPTGIVGIPPRAMPKKYFRDLEAQPTDEPAELTIAEIDFGLISQDQGRGADDRVLLGAAWIDRIATVSLERLEFLAGETSQTVQGVEGDELGMSGKGLGEVEPPTEALRVEFASIAQSVGLGALAMIAFRNRHRVFGRMSQTGRPEPGRSQRRLLKGPHRRNLALR